MSSLNFLQIILCVIKVKVFINYFVKELYVPNKNYLLYSKGAVVCKASSTWVYRSEMADAGKSMLKSSFQFGKKGVGVRHWILRVLIFMDTVIQRTQWMLFFNYP